MNSIWQDLRISARMLRKNRGFTVVAVLTLALGIAVNATMFSMVSAFLLRRPPGRNPERVVVVSSIDPNGTFLPDTSLISAPNHLAWRASNHVFADTAAADEFRRVALTSQGQATTAGEPESLRAAAISPNYFTVLGVSTELGRTFADGEDQPGHDHVVILSHELWERRFGGDPSVIGRGVRLNRENYTVVGVMPASFQLLGFIPQLWTPLTLTAADETASARKDRSLYLFARLKPGVTLQQARAELKTLGRRAEQDFPDTEKGWGVAVRTLPDFLLYSFEIGSTLAVLMTTVGFVLMIACANVAGLMLARAAGRRKELAIRISLGAGRVRIVRQLLTEGMLIAFLGGGAGLLLAVWGINIVRANMNFNEAAGAVPLGPDWNVLLFTIGACFLCAVLCGIAPALNASRTDINTSLKDEGRAASAGRSRSRLRMVMVTAQIVLAMFLLVGTGLLMRGIFLLEHQNLGFRPDHLLTAGVTLDDSRYKDDAQRVRFVRDVISRLQNTTGVESAAAGSDLPATGPSSVPVRIKGQPEMRANEQLTTLDVIATPNYFGTAGIPLVGGRAFTEKDDAAASRVVVVNQEFVRRYLKDQDPLGQQIRLDVGGGAAPSWNEIVGVVGDVKNNSMQPQTDPEVYEAYFERPVSALSLMIRTTADPNSVASGLREAVAQVDDELPLIRVMSMPALIQRQKGGTPFFERIMTSFAILALILAGIGIYGLIAYSVGQRSHEIGIRLVLGASKRDVLRMILWEGMKTAGIGAAIGLLAALPLPGVFESIFYGLINVREPWIYVVVPTAVLAVAILATYVPARRAAKVDPIGALRTE
jgi:predicted permease